MSNTTRLIDKLIEKNLVKREICIDNRRKIELSITQKGLDLLIRLDPLISSEEEKLLELFGEQNLKYNLNVPRIIHRLYRWTNNKK